MKTITRTMLEEYADYLQEEEKSVATITKYIRDVSMFADWLKNGDLTKGLVLQYKELLLESYAPASVNSILSSLNSFFMYREWYHLKVKTVKIQRQLFASQDKELTKVEYERLLSAAKKKSNRKLYYLLQTICSTGIRVSELRFVTVESLRARKAIIHLKGKVRLVILPEQLCRFLLCYTKEQGIKKGPVFVTKRGTPLDRSNIWKMMKSLCESAGVAKEKVFPHNLRHLFARTYYSIQKDIVRLADILGHSSVNTTRIYTAENGEVHRRQIQHLGLLRC